MIRNGKENLSNPLAPPPPPQLRGASSTWTGHLVNHTTDTSGQTSTSHLQRIFTGRDLDTARKRR